MRFLFVSGSHKSGTSWLAHMIGGHEAIKLPRQELWLFGHPASLAGIVNESVNSWLDLPTVSQQFNDEKARLNAVNAVIRGAIRGAISAAVGDVSNISYIGDKTPAFYALSAEELFKVFPDACFIHIVRDPRDVVVSHHYHAYRLEEWSFFSEPDVARERAKRVLANEEIGADLLDLGAVKRLGRDWRKVQLGGARAKELYDSKYLECTYETLSADPEATIAGIFKAIGVNSDSALVENIVGKFSFKSMSRGREVGQQDASSFFRKGIVGDWQNHFNEKSFLVLDKECGDVARSYQYWD